MYSVICYVSVCSIETGGGEVVATQAFVAFVTVCFVMYILCAGSCSVFSFDPSTLLTLYCYRCHLV